MKLKGTLWALAFAFAAVSCSDDLENSGKNNQPEESEQKAYLAVKIDTGTKGISTKGNGEEGDDYLPEIVGLEEDKVYDINIFLFERKETEHEVNGGLEAVNRDETSPTTIAGYGYLAGINETPSGGREPDHQEVTVKITLDDTFTETESKNYWVLAVVNNGSQITPTTLSNLRESLSGKAWTGGASGIDSYEKFVMSTHMMKGQVGSASLVNISQANKSPDDPARTTVYVERLAARVDLKVSETMAGNIRTDGTFEILRYLPINLWQGDTYMFKQVSPSVTTINTALPDANTKHPSGEYQWLGDELWETGKYNYVYSVDMRKKTQGNYSKFDGLYDNFFYQATEDAALPYDTESTEWEETLTLGQEGTYTSTDGFTPIFYTRENTMTALSQRNGYTTGLIFESQFEFKDGATVSSYNSTKGEVEATALPAENNGTFYVANHDGNVTFDGLKTIAATAFKELTEAADGVDYKVTADLLKGFMDGNWPTTAPTIEKVRSIVQYMSEKNGIEKKFKEYLKGVLDGAGTGATFDNVRANLNYDKFIEPKDDLKEPVGGIDDTYIATLYKDYKVSCYKEGKSYHKYWIQHDPSDPTNGREDQVLGVMEYGIVRNNVYQLNVTGIRDLGDPLPFTPGKDDPDTPDEKEEAYTILVHLYVKDWILRKNQDIIL